MVADPLAAFGALAGFMRIAATPQAIARAVAHADFKQAAAMEKAAGFKERSPAQDRFFRSGTSGQWRDVLTAGQVAAVVGAHREQMERYGYVPEGY
jgi:hypothetical protein